jgi:Na+/melibiose symporter-like transporter
MTDVTKTTAKAPSLRTKIAYGLGSAAFGIKDQGFGFFLLIFYSQVIGVDARLVGLALTIALVVDAISDPIVGYLSDNFRSRWGRRHLFMYASAVPVAISYFLLWNPPVGWSRDSLFWYLVVLAVLTRTFITFFETPNAALAPELTRDYDQRSNLQSWRSFFGWTFGNAMTVMMFIALFPAFVTADIPNGQFNREAYSVYAWIAAGLIFLAIVLSSLGTHGEAARLSQPPVRKVTLGMVFQEIFQTLANKSFLAIFLMAMFAFVAAGLGGALSVYFSTFFWGFKSEQIGLITLAIFFSATLGAVVAPILSRRLGKKQAAMALCFAGMIISPLGVILRLFGVLQPATDAAFWFVFTLGQIDVIIVVATQILIASMISDLVEQSEVKTGRRSEGVFFAANTFIQKITSGLGLTIASLVLALAAFPTGAAPGQVPDSVLVALGWWYLPVMLLLRLLMLGAISLYALDRKAHEENLDKLKARQPPAS